MLIKLILRDSFAEVRYVQVENISSLAGQDGVCRIHMTCGKAWVTHESADQFIARVESRWREIKKPTTAEQDFVGLYPPDFED